MTEGELFSDPKASLDKIAGAPPPGPRIDPTADLKGYGEVGPSADEAVRDPFRPLGADKAVSVLTPDPGAPREGAATEDTTPPAAAPAPVSAQSPVLQQTVEPKTDLKAEPPAAVTRAEPPKAEAAPAVKATANDLASARRRKRRSAELTERREALAARLLADVKGRLAADLQSPSGPQLDVRATDEGILISLTDRNNFSMFAIGSAEPQRRVIRTMDAIAMSLEAIPGTIVVRGHTDAHPYRSATYDNWRLSSARAQMAYYMLLRGGVPEKRFDRIEGFADHRLKDPAHPLAAENRRIEVLLREQSP